MLQSDVRISSRFISLLQNTRNSGLKNNLLRTYTQIPATPRRVLTSQAVFVAAWLHALLQERRTFIPQAWTKFYEFGAGDVRVARLFIEHLTADGGNHLVPMWQSIFRRRLGIRKRIAAVRNLRRTD